MSRNGFKVEIKGQEWTFFTQTKSSYIRKHGGDSEGITYPKAREVYLKKTTLSPRYIRHEIMHCYVDGSDTYACQDFTKDDMEELCCVIIADHGPSIHHLAEKIFEHFMSKGEE